MEFIKFWQSKILLRDSNLNFAVFASLTQFYILMNIICLTFHLIGHLERKHNIPPGSDGHAPSAKRSRAVLDDDDGNYTTMEQQIHKRARFIANSTSIHERSSIDAMIQRPRTPSTPPPATQNPADGNATERASTLRAVRVQNETYNVVHISDRELNKLMRNGRIEVKNGQLILSDSVEQE